MKNKILNGVLCGSFFLIMFACNNKQAEPALQIDKEEIKQQIQEKENLFADTYNAGEMKNIGYYADDAIAFYQNKKPLVGKGAIVDYLAEGIDSFSSTNKISFTTNEVFVSNDGVQVVEVGYYKVVDSTNATINSGNYMTLFEKRDGKYVSLREMSASDIVEVFEEFEEIEEEEIEE